MNRSTLLAAALVAITVTGTGAVVAIAQDGAPQAMGQQMQGMKMMRAGWGDGERGWGRHGGEGRHWGKHHGGRHGMGGHGGMFRTLFTEVDADKDGKITQAEIDTFREAKVASADASGDGSLSIEEFDTLYREFTRSRMVDAFQRLDDDGDGQITRAELDARLANVVKFMDRNGDGALSMEDRGRGRR
ncbi:EF-hand domain-containing protein [Zhengella sp. ZM62]|uniref:EF-hand domain-containing protein n=1 Tax=Zhengella sedimenti TaxID=3390035 RepID=UPI003974C51E